MGLAGATNPIVEFQVIDLEIMGELIGFGSASQALEEKPVIANEAMLVLFKNCFRDIDIKKI